jgi:predicted transcriptional regulator
LLVWLVLLHLLVDWLEFVILKINGIQSKRYLTYLLSERLIEKRSNTLYAATEKGRVLLEKYEKLRLEK